MPDTPTDIIAAAFEAFNRGDIDALLEVFDRDAEWHDPDRPGGGVYRGHDGVKQAIAEWMEDWTSFHAEPERVTEVGDHVLVVIHQFGTGRSSGVEIDQRLAQVARVRDGKVVWLRLYTDIAEAARSLGLAGHDETAARDVG